MPSENGRNPSDVPIISADPGILVSAALGWNLDGLVEEIERQLEGLGVLVSPVGSNGDPGWR